MYEKNMQNPSHFKIFFVKTFTVFLCFFLPLVILTQNVYDEEMKKMRNE